MTGYSNDATTQVYSWVEKSERKDTIVFTFGPAGENLLVVKNDTFRLLQIVGQDKQSIGVKPYGSTGQGFTSYYLVRDTVNIIIRSANFIDKKRLPGDRLVFEPVR